MGGWAAAEDELEVPIGFDCQLAEIQVQNSLRADTRIVSPVRLSLVVAVTHVCETVISILPDTDPTGSWRQLVFKTYS